MRAPSIIGRLGKLFAISLCLALPCFAQPAKSGVQITELTNTVRIEINGALFSEYRYSKEDPKPCFYPIIGPNGAGMTRNWPLKETPNEEHDHPHHRGLWYGHGLVNGVDFWTEGPTKGRVLHRGFDELKSGKDSGLIKSRNDWVAPDGKVICTDERIFRVFAGPAQERLCDFEITFHASHGELTLGDTKEAALAIRMAETMRVNKQTPKRQKPIRGDGRLITSEGVRDVDAWGKRGDWCDYSGPVNGKTVGIAIFDHPSNPHHSTWWMVRDYGLHAANPFGKNAFENTGDVHAGDVVIPAGKSVTFRYRLYIHEGDEMKARVADRYAEYAKSK